MIFSINFRNREQVRGYGKDQPVHMGKLMDGPLGFLTSKHSFYFKLKTVGKPDFILSLVEHSIGKSTISLQIFYLILFKAPVLEWGTARMFVFSIFRPEDC